MGNCLLPIDCWLSSHSNSDRHAAALAASASGPAAEQSSRVPESSPDPAAAPDAAGPTQVQQIVEIVYRFIFPEKSISSSYIILSRSANLRWIRSGEAVQNVLTKSKFEYLPEI